MDVWAGGVGPLFQLTVLAAPSVVSPCSGMPPVELGLAVDAMTHARNRLASGLWDIGAAFLAVREALAARQAAARELHRFFHAGIDLILDGSVPAPASGHDLIYPNSLVPVFSVSPDGPDVTPRVPTPAGGDDQPNLSRQQ